MYLACVRERGEESSTLANQGKGKWEGDKFKTVHPPKKDGDARNNDDGDFYPGTKCLE